MDRKEFLRGCVTGLCGCAAAACMPKAASAAEAAKDDWRLPFVKQRYAKLISSLGERVDQKTLSASLQDLGAFCASQGDDKTKKFAGNVDGYLAELAKNGQAVTRVNSTFTMSYDPKGPCACPLNGEKTPGTVCECSIGWAKHNWSIVLGKEPKVALLESVLRGGKVCKFEITAA